MFSAAMAGAHALIVAVHVRVVLHDKTVHFHLTRKTISVSAILVLLYLAAGVARLPRARVGLWATAAAWGVFSHAIMTSIVRAVYSKGFLRAGGHRFVVYAIEHIAERFGLFTVIVLGEVLTAMFYHVDPQAPHWNAKPLLISLCALLCASSIQSIYFDVDAGVQASHAVRRKWYTGVLW